jgi:erythromycin esterase
MKRHLLTCLTTSLLSLSGLSAGFAQSAQINDAPVFDDQSTIIKQSHLLTTKPVLVKDSTGSFEFSALKTVYANSYQDFKNAVKPLIARMSTKRIVALGEGTHGTAEFYKMRYWISRILVEEKGFNHIAFENDFSDGWYITKGLNENADLNALMKKHMLSIWQNEETKEMLTWLRNYNSKHKKKVVVDGLDYVMLTRDVELLQELIEGKVNADLTFAIKKLAIPAALQDSAWNGMNLKEFKFDWKNMETSSKNAYLSADSVDKQVGKLDLSPVIKAQSHIALTNLMQGFAPFYGDTATRDSLMALNTSLILNAPTDKMIIWAHNGHVAKTAIYNNAVGGCGGYLLKMFPDNYFVLGTGTAEGTFAATVEARDTYTNPMAAYPLEHPIKGSWEELLSSHKTPVMYFDPAEFNINKLVKPLRFVGYTPKSGPSTYDKTNISDLYDAFLFIKDSHAATPLK